MKDYPYDTYLLSSEFHHVAQWWDSDVFLDKNNPSIILKLYDPLSHEQIQRYYQIQSKIAHKLGIVSEGNLEIQVVDPTLSEKFQITDNEDWVLVVLPRIAWVNLCLYGSHEQRTRIVHRVKNLLKNKGLPVSGGFEIKSENIMVNTSQWDEKLKLYITDVWARIDECIRQGI